MSNSATQSTRLDSLSSSGSFCFFAVSISNSALGVIKGVVVVAGVDDAPEFVSFGAGVFGFIFEGISITESLDACEELTVEPAPRWSQKVFICLSPLTAESSRGTTQWPFPDEMRMSAVSFEICM